MEYVHQRGAFDDVPLQQMLADFARFYPRMPLWSGAQPDAASLGDADFLADVARETAGAPPR
jgi:hypothetical protein